MDEKEDKFLNGDKDSPKTILFLEYLIRGGPKNEPVYVTEEDAKRTEKIKGLDSLAEPDSDQFSGDDFRRIQGILREGGDIVRSAYIATQGREFSTGPSLNDSYSK